MRAGLIQGGIAFLLLFAPFAFGGVEAWAIGVIQIACGAVFAGWAWRYDEPVPDRSSFRILGTRLPTLRPLWTVFFLFVGLVVFQLTPLPASWIEALAPATHRLYQDTLPGYAEGEIRPVADIPAWITSSEDASAAVPGRVAAQGSIPSALSPVRSQEPSTSRTLSIYPYRTRQNLSLLLSYAAVFAVVVAWYRTRIRFQRLLDMAVAAAFLLSLFGILQKLGSNGLMFWVRAGPHTEFFGPFVNRNSYAAFAGSVLPVAVGLCLASLTSWRRGRTDETPRLLFYGFASVIIAAGVALSLSRGGMLSAGLSLLLLLILLLILGRRGPELGLLGGLVATAGVFLLWLNPGEVVDRVETISQGLANPSLAMRIVAWKQTLIMAESNLYLGTGLGTFRFAFLGFAPPGKAWWTAAHNEYLELLCDVGIVGGLLVLVGLIVYGRRVLRPQVISGPMATYAYSGLVSGLVGMLVHCAVSSNLQVPANGILLAVLGGALVTLVAREEAQRDGRKRHARRAGKRA